MLGHWETLLSDVALDPGRCLPQFNILPAVEEQTLLCDWNNTDRPYADNKTLAQLFLEQARRTPDNLALIAGDARLTYRELAIRAIAVARALRDAGIAKENLVGVCVERSWEMIASIFGTLLGGALTCPWTRLIPVTASPS
jgi:fengycin family lipopeptide synthetase D